MPTPEQPTALIRLKPADLERLEMLQLPGEHRSTTFLRLLHEALLPPAFKVRYKKPPIFPEWCEVGPLSAIAASDRAEALLRKAFEVVVVPAEPAG